MLIINGMENSIFPIEDSLIAGVKGADGILLPWLDDVIAGKP